MYKVISLIQTRNKYEKTIYKRSIFIFLFCFVAGSPFKFHVDSLASGYVTAYGPGLIYGVCGEPGNFTVSTKGAGAGGLSLAVEGPSKADISCHDNKDGTVSVSYLPTAPGEYKISVKFGDKPIKGSPYVAKITGQYLIYFPFFLHSNFYQASVLLY